MQRIQRKRTVQKIYADFVECSKIVSTYYPFIIPNDLIKGAEKVITGGVEALNPNDTRHQQIFVYNNIFFSFTVNSPEDFSTS